MADVNIKINVDTTNATPKIKEVSKDLEGLAVAAKQTGQAVDGTIKGALLSLGSLALSFAALAAASKLLKLGQDFLKYGAILNQVAKDQIDFKNSLNGVGEKALSVGAQLQAFVNIAKDSTLPLSQRNEALKEANKLMGEHGDKLTLVNVGTSKVTEQIKLLTEALVNEAIAAKYADRVAELRIKQIEATKEYTKAQNDFNAATERYNKLIAGNSGVRGALKPTNGALVEAASNYKQIRDQIVETTNDLYNSEAAATKGMGELGVKTKETKVHVKELKDEIDKFIKHPHFDLLDMISSDQANQNYLDGLKKEEQKIQETLKKYPINIPVGVTLDKPLIEKQLTEFGQELGYLVENSITDLASLIGDTFSSLFNGNKGALKGLLEGTLHMFGTFLERLGKAAIATSTVMKAIQAALAGAPGLGFVAGIAAIVLGRVLEGIKIPGFADGVTNFGGGMAIVGERGPELVRLPRGSDVIPNHLIGDVGMGQQIYIPAITLRGQDLVLAFNRASATINRNG